MTPRSVAAIWVAGSLGTSLPATAGDYQALEIRPARRAIALGSGAHLSVDLSVDPAVARAGTIPRLLTNVGAIEAVREVSPGQFRATYIAPPPGPPATAVLVGTLSTREGLAIGSARLELVGVLGIEIETAPGVRVTLQAEGKTYGPSTTDADGRVAFRVSARKPELDYTYRIHVGDTVAARRERVSAVSGAPSATIAALMSEGRRLRWGDAVTLAVASVAELTPESRGVNCRSVLGGELERVGVFGNLALVRTNIPVGANRRLRVRCAYGDTTPGEVTLLVYPPPPASIEIEHPDVHIAGHSAPRLSVIGYDDAGHRVPLADPALVRIEGDSGAWQLALAATPDPTGIITVATPLPTRMLGDRRARIVAEVAGASLRAEATMELWPADAAVIEVRRPPAPVLADGRSSVRIDVSVTDAYLNPVRAGWTARARLGTLERSAAGLRYVAPELAADAVDTVELRAGELLETVDVRLVAPPAWGLGLEAAAAISHRAAPGVAVALRLEHTRAWNLGFEVGAVVGTQSATVVEGVRVVSRWEMLGVSAFAGYTVDWAPVYLRADLGGGAAWFFSHREGRRGDAVVLPSGVDVQWVPQLGLRIEAGWQSSRWSVGLAAASRWAPPVGGVAQTWLFTLGPSGRWVW